MRSPRRGILAAVLSLATAMVVTSGCDAPPRVLGVSTYGSAVDAARLAYAEALARDSLPGVDTVMIPDPSPLAEPAIRAATTLVSRAGIIAVVGHANSSASLAAAPLYAGHQVVQISPTASAVTYSQAGPFSFRMVPPDDRQGTFLAEQVRARFPDGARLAVFYVSDDYGRGLRRAFLSRLDSDAYPAVVDLPHVEGVASDAEVEQMARAVARTGPDIVVWLARGNLLRRSLPAFRAARPGVPVLAGDAVLGGGMGDLGDPVLLGVEAVSFVDLGATEAGRAFQERFRARFGEEPTGGDALAYDAMAVLLEGLRQGVETGPEMRAYLTSLGRQRPAFEGVTGPLHFDAEGAVRRSYRLRPLGQGEGG